jgi:hypothetical protein
MVNELPRVFLANKNIGCGEHRIAEYLVTGHQAGLADRTRLRAEISGELVFWKIPAQLAMTSDRSSNVFQPGWVQLTGAL